MKKLMCETIDSSLVHKMKVVKSEDAVYDAVR